MAQGSVKTGSITEKYFDARAAPILYCNRLLRLVHLDHMLKSVFLVSSHLLHIVGGRVCVPLLSLSLCVCVCVCETQMSIFYSSIQPFEITCGWKSKTILLQRESDLQLRGAKSLMNLATTTVQTHKHIQAWVSSSTPASLHQTEGGGWCKRLHSILWRNTEWRAKGERLWRNES